MNKWLTRVRDLLPSKNTPAVARDLGPHPARMTPMSALRIEMDITVQEAAVLYHMSAEDYMILEAQPMTDLAALATRAQADEGTIFLDFRAKDSQHTTRFRIGVEGYVEEIIILTTRLLENSSGS